MAKSSVKYVCQECGNTSLKWAGQCDGCHGWNTLVEESVETISKLGTKKGREISFMKLSDKTESPPRLVTGNNEFDRVCGGGLVQGSVLLVGGDPGIGKSTLLLQITSRIADQVNCAYISGEESADQVRLRAKRLGVDHSPVQLATSTNVRDILATMVGKEAPKVVVIDSIQTMYVDTLDAAPGSVGQVRTSAHELIRQAKKRGITVIIVGHVTKEGTIAGPRVLEHMVDTVLYFEGERNHQFRILRSVKNRFGATDEIGVFEMSDKGLAEVPNPSALFLADRHGDITGSCVFAGIEGTRPILVEVQALIAPSNLATPRRAVVGWDSARLSMILAVLEARCGVTFAGRDVFLNVAGGLRISEPAADMAVAAALLSSLSGTPISHDTVYFGEIGLSGEIRSVGQQEGRIKEAEKLGFQRVCAPAQRSQKSGEKPSSIQELRHLSQLVSLFDHGNAPQNKDCA